MSTICTNRKAGFEYNILEKIEAGIELLGTEVKSLREGRCSLKDSFAKIESDECFLYNCHIADYPQGIPHEPTRKRRLLLHKEEIRRLAAKTQKRGLTLVPTRLYFRKSRVKVELALAKGKKLYDKREILKKRSAQREIERTLKAKNLS
jgi:SsrA-binding protein